MAVYRLLAVVSMFVLVHAQTIESDTTEDVVQCNMCVNRFNWTECDTSAMARDCSLSLVDRTHAYLAQYNPELIETTGSNVTDHQFRCFLLELEIDVSTVNVFIRGCTYDDTTFCEGWSANGARATNCAICSSGSCERNATWDALLATTTTVDPTTTVSSTSQSSSASITETPCIVDWTAAASSISTSSSSTPVSQERSSTSSASSSTPPAVTTPASSVAPETSPVSQERSTISSASSSTSPAVTTPASSAAPETSTQSHDISTPAGVTSVIPAAGGINCIECDSAVSWEHCMNRSRSVQCTTADVNELHSGLQKFNPNLPVGNYSDFKCFTMKGNFSDPEHGGVMYGSGCTYASARFCTRDLWHNVTIMECSGSGSLRAATFISLSVVAVLTMVISKYSGKC